MTWRKLDAHDIHRSRKPKHPIAYPINAKLMFQCKIHSVAWSMPEMNS
jgi:hypothetical protein